MKLGEMPAWGGFLLTFVCLLLAAGVAWGAANARLSHHDDELAEIKADSGAMREMLNDLREDVATLLERTRP